MKNLIIASIALMFTLSSCDGSDFLIFMSHPQIAYMQFKNTAGENLIVKNQIKLDSLTDPSGSEFTRYFIDSKEYKLRIVIDEQEYKADRLITDKYGSCIELTCSEHRPQVMGQKRPFVYDFFLSCPKLFGDDKEHKISVLFTIVANAAGAYTIKELTVDNTKLVPNDGVVVI